MLPTLPFTANDPVRSLFRLTVLTLALITVDPPRLPAVVAKLPIVPLPPATVIVPM